MTDATDRRGMHMQRLTSEYRASLILAAANAGPSPVPGATLEPEGSPRGRRIGYRDDYRDVEDFDTDHRDVDCDLSGADDDDQPSYWYWSFDRPDAGI
jgi:hypothetical protein